MMNNNNVRAIARRLKDMLYYRRDRLRGCVFSSHPADNTRVLQVVMD